MNRFKKVKRTQPFEKADLRIANQECGPDDFVGDRCPVCAMKVILHCDKCLVQITGCLCTLKEKIRQHEDLSLEEADIARRSGLWTPGQGEKR